MSSPQIYQTSSSPTHNAPFEVEAPVDVYTYAHIMHQHTKRQMEAASRRRSPQAGDRAATHDKQGSVSSMDSRRS